METDAINDPKNNLNESLLDVEMGVEMLSGDSVVFSTSYYSCLKSDVNYVFILSMQKTNQI
jgi:hypothetical protein